MEAREQTAQWLVTEVCFFSAGNRNTMANTILTINLNNTRTSSASMLMNKRFSRLEKLNENIAPLS